MTRHSSSFFVQRNEKKLQRKKSWYISKKRKSKKFPARKKTAKNEKNVIASFWFCRSQLKIRMNLLVSQIVSEFRRMHNLLLLFFNFRFTAKNELIVMHRNGSQIATNETKRTRGVGKLGEKAKEKATVGKKIKTSPSWMDCVCSLTYIRQRNALWKLVLIALHAFLRWIAISTTNTLRTHTRTQI